MDDKNLELIPEINTTLDYDKEPIIIEDYNSLFIFLLNISLIPIIVYIYIYNPGGLDEGSLSRNIVIRSFFMSFFIRPYLKSKGKRKIVLTNNNIKFMHENKILEEIRLSEITDIKKTYIDLYHNSQVPNKLILIFGYIIIILFVISQKAYYLLFLILFLHIFLVITKYILHKMKDKNYKYRLFDAIIVYNNDKFINILPTTNKDYQKVRNYFLDKSLGDIKNKKIYFEIAHSFERINLSKGN
ncbi:hypothetical protein O8C85_01980 [Aliarcobacter butzleri]|uniref:hypothetical protein n=1 Tax=Aliarcobacter butzleri TaxID=28197 RepID=UPI00263C26FB|nr:hypothetical protein [Aliarcobacter butzleri]MDN5097303.1 hypothetical protein [Aliarcobacter butzleri]